MGRRRVTKIGADLDFGKSGLRDLWFAIGSGHWSLHPFTPMLGCGSNAFPVTPALAELFQRIEVAACAGSVDLDLQHETGPRSSKKYRSAWSSIQARICSSGLPALSPCRYNTPPSIPSMENPQLVDG